MPVNEPHGGRTPVSLFRYSYQSQLHRPLAQALFFQLVLAVAPLHAQHAHRPAAYLVAPVAVLAAHRVLHAQICLAFLVKEDGRAAEKQAHDVRHIL